MAMVYFFHLVSVYALGILISLQTFYQIQKQIYNLTVGDDFEISSIDFDASSIVLI